MAKILGGGSNQVSVMSGRTVLLSSSGVGAVAMRGSANAYKLPRVNPLQRGIHAREADGSGGGGHILSFVLGGGYQGIVRRSEGPACVEASGHSGNLPLRASDGDRVVIAVAQVVVKRILRRQRSVRTRGSNRGRRKLEVGTRRASTGATDGGAPLIAAHRLRVMVARSLGKWLVLGSKGTAR
jgi:hypothetical protein